MGVLSQIWQIVILPSQKSDLAVFAGQLDQLASGQGYIRPDSIPSPRSFTDTDPASRMEAWEAWYNAAPVTQGTLPPTATFGQNTTTTPASWSALVALAAARTVPDVIRAYLAVQGSSWDTARPHWTGDGAPVFQTAEMAYQTWWYNRLGGTAGTPAPWPRGDAAGTPVGGAAGAPTSGGASGGSSDFVKALLALGLALLLKKKRR